MFTTTQTIKERHQQIRNYLQSDPVVAVLLAAANLEWCLNRMLFIFSDMPNRIIKETIQSYVDPNGKRIDVSGLGGYASAWRNCGAEAQYGPLRQIFKDVSWSELHEAMKLRHKLIHGRIGTTGYNYASKRANVLLAAAADCEQFAKRNNRNIYNARLPVRRVKKASG